MFQSTVFALMDKAYRFGPYQLAAAYGAQYKFEVFNYLEVHVRPACDRRSADAETLSRCSHDPASRVSDLASTGGDTLSQRPQVRDSHHAIIDRVGLNLLTTIARHKHERLSEPSLRVRRDCLASACTRTSSADAATCRRRNTLETNQLICKPWMPTSLRIVILWRVSYE